jgi:hypothetical protein
VVPFEAALAITALALAWRTPVVWVLTAYGAAALLAATLQGKFFAYHFSPLLPAICGLAAVGAGTLWSTGRGLARAFGFVLLLCVGVLAVRRGWRTLAQEADARWRFCYEESPIRWSQAGLGGYPEIARWLRENTGPSEMVCSINAPGPLFLARRPVFPINVHPFVLYERDIVPNERVLSIRRRIQATFLASPPRVCVVHRALAHDPTILAYLETHYEPALEIPPLAVYRRRSTSRIR